VAVTRSSKRLEYALKSQPCSAQQCLFYARFLSPSPAPNCWPPALSGRVFPAGTVFNLCSKALRGSRHCYVSPRAHQLPSATVNITGGCACTVATHWSGAVAVDVMLQSSPASIYQYHILGLGRCIVGIPATLVLLHTGSAVLCCTCAVPALHGL
jgi:hypothetical protein